MSENKYSQQAQRQPEPVVAPAPVRETMVAGEAGPRRAECKDPGCMCHIKGRLPEISTKRNPTARPSWDDIKAGWTPSK